MRSSRWGLPLGRGTASNLRMRPGGLSNLRGGTRRCLLLSFPDAPHFSFPCLLLWKHLQQPCPAPWADAHVLTVSGLQPARSMFPCAWQDEMLGKLKDLGNSLLGKFGLSVDNFKAVKDEKTGGYSISFQQ